MLIRRITSTLIRLYYRLRPGNKLGKYISAYGEDNDGNEYFVKFRRPVSGVPLDTSGSDKRIIDNIVYIVAPPSKRFYPLIKE